MQTLASVLIIVFSAGLFAFWFRYSCLLILRTRTSMDYSLDVVSASNLSVLNILDRLEGELRPQELAEFGRMIEHDYRIVHQLLSRAPRLGERLTSLERFMLQVDFKMMSAWNRASSLLLGGPRKEAVAEMSEIVSFLANAAGAAGVLSVES
jgi:hypothetical protein